MRFNKSVFGGCARILNGLLLLGVLLALGGDGALWAQSQSDTADTGDWPADVADPSPAERMTPNAAPSPTRGAGGLIPGKKKSFWRRSPFKKEPPPPSEEKIINVGPRAHAASAGMLLRLPRPVTLDSTRRLSPGFYLARLQSASGAAPALSLSAGGRAMGLVPLRPGGAPSPEPVESIHQDHVAVAPRLDVSLSADGRFLTITVREGARLYVSDPLPAERDDRPELPY